MLARQTSLWMVLLVSVLIIAGCGGTAGSGGTGGAAGTGGTGGTGGAAGTGGTGGAADFTPDPDTYYVLQTVGSEGRGECFDGNEYIPEDPFVGEAFMNTCDNGDRQQWKFVPDNFGNFVMYTKFSETTDQCLEGASIEAGGALDGAAFMPGCGPVNGQRWSIVRVDDETFALQNDPFSDEDKCLDGNPEGPDAPDNGGAGMTDCTQSPNQSWFATPTE